MASTTTSTNAASAGLVALALVVSMTSCGSEDEASSDLSEQQTASNGDVFNGADVRFATDMIPHHAEAIAMVTLANGRPLDPEVEQLAVDIRDAQAPEVETMVDWLTAWDQEVPETSLDHVNGGHNMGDGDPDDMDDMGDMGDLTVLTTASDDEFQDLWLEMMIEHHAGAIEMAEAEQQDGEYADAIALAESIESSQQREIEKMESLLGS